MPALFIPELGTDLELSSDWEFTLYYERRNKTLWDLLDGNSTPQYVSAKATLDTASDESDQGMTRRREWFDANPNKLWPDYEKSSEYQREIHWAKAYQQARQEMDTLSLPVVLPKGSILRVDRIYIRQGLEGYSSLTFSLRYAPDAKFDIKKGRRPRFWVKLAEVNTMEIA